MYPQTVDFEQLQHLTGYLRLADIEKWCEKHKVRYLRSPAGIFTTTTAINAALGIYPHTVDHYQKPQPLEF